MSHTLPHDPWTFTLWIILIPEHLCSLSSFSDHVSSKCGLPGVFLYLGRAHVSENFFQKSLYPSEKLSETLFPENKKTHLRNIHCPTDMSVNFISAAAYTARPHALDFLGHRLLSLYCWSRILLLNVMQCKENNNYCLYLTFTDDTL